MDKQKEENKEKPDLLVKGYSAEIKDLNKNEKSVTAYVSTITKDSYREVVLPVFDLIRFQKNPVVLWAHDSFSPPVGRAAWLKTDKTGLIAKTIFTTKTQMGADIWSLFLEKMLNAFSIGFLPKTIVSQGDDGFSELLEEWNFDESAARVFSDNELYEYSAVPVPANPDAVTMILKSNIIKSENLKRQFEDVLHDNIETTIEETKSESSNADVLAELRKINDRLDSLEGAIGEVSKERLTLYEEALKLEEKLKEKHKSKAKPESEKDSPEIVVGPEEALARVPRLVDGAIRELKGRVS